MSFSASIVELVKNSQSPLIAAASSWERVPLSSIANILNGFPWRSTHFNTKHGEPVLRIRDVTTGRIETLYDGPIEQGYWIDNGDLVVGMDGDFNCRIWDGGRALLNQRVCRITPDRRFYSGGFLARLLPGYLKLINDETHSVTVKHLSSNTLAALPLPLPPLSEQRRIVAKIDSLSGKSKRARDHLDHVSRLVEKYKNAVLAAAFRGELTEGWRVQAGRTSPWARVRLGELVADIRYGTAKKCSYDSGAVPVLRIPNVQRGEIALDDLKRADFDASEVAKLRLARGDLLVIRSNGSLDLVGRSAVVRDEAVGMLFAGYLIRLRLRPDLANAEFIHLCLQGAELRAIIMQTARSTSGVNNINSDEIKSLQVELPGLSEQLEIVRRVKRAFNWIDRLASETTSARKLVGHLDQAILAKAFRGELVPQDLSDEPASVLLERIRAERAAALFAKAKRKAKARA